MVLDSLWCHAHAMQWPEDHHLHVLKVLSLFGQMAAALLASHILAGVCSQTTLFTKGGYTISLKTIVGQDTLCQAINQPDQSKCACTSDYYLVDIEDGSYTTYAAIVLPANKAYWCWCHPKGSSTEPEQQGCSLNGASLSGSGTNLHMGVGFAV